MQALIATALINLVDELKISLRQRFSIYVQVAFEGFLALRQLGVFLVRGLPRSKVANLWLYAFDFLFDFLVFEVP